MAVDEFSATPRRFSEAAREHYAKLYGLPGAMHSGFMQFAAFDQDALDNRAFLAKGKLPMPVLAIGGGKSFGKTMAEIMRFAATNVREGVIPDSGHWIMEENPGATIAMVRASLSRDYEAQALHELPSLIQRQIMKHRHAPVQPLVSQLSG